VLSPPNSSAPDREYALRQATMLAHVGHYHQFDAWRSTFNEFCSDYRKETKMVKNASETGRRSLSGSSGRRIARQYSDGGIRIGVPLKVALREGDSCNGRERVFEASESRVRTSFARSSEARPRRQTLRAALEIRVFAHRLAPIKPRQERSQPRGDMSRSFGSAHVSVGSWLELSFLRNLERRVVNRWKAPHFASHPF